MDDSPAAHDQHAVADADGLRQIGRDHQDGFAGASEPVYQLVNFPFGANIYAAGRFIEDKQPRIAQQPARQRRFLLISAGQGADRQFNRVFPQPQPAHLLKDGGADGFAFNHAAGDKVIQLTDINVVLNRMTEKQSLGFTVFGHHSNTVGNSGGGV